MPGPFDLTIRPQTQLDPLGSFNSGLQIGDSLATGMQQDIKFQQEQQARAAAIAQQQQQQQRAELAAKNLAALSKGIADGTASARSANAFVVQFPEFAEKLAEPLKRMSADEQANYLDTAGQAHAAQVSGNGEAAIKVLEDAAARHEQQGDPAFLERAKGLRNLAEQMRSNPAQAQAMTAAFLAKQLGPEKYEAAFGSLWNADANRAQAVAKTEEDEVKAGLAWERELAKIGLDQAQAERLRNQTDLDRQRLGLDRDIFRDKVAARRAAASGSGLSSAQQKEYDAATIKGVGAAMSADTTKALAKKFRELDDGNPVMEFLNTGLNGRAGNWISTTFGLKDEMVALRKQYKALINKDLLNSLPPGAASDKDVAIVREAFESEYSDFGQLAEALDAMERIQRAVAVNSDTQAEWLRQNKGLHPATRPIEIEGRTFPAGTKYVEVTSTLQQERDEATKKERATEEADDFFGSDEDDDG